ncbi:hypothetical protein NQL31_001527 [Lotmaria passim]
MQVELSFIFPHVLRELPVSFFIPLPAQRPRTVANLAFMSTGQLPLADGLLNALHLAPTDIAYATPAEAKAAGLVPFSDSAVIRIDQTTVMEVGSSTTRTIFGGFIPDEPLQLPADTVARGKSIAATMSTFKAGSLLCGNLGTPNTQASRYFILLSSLTTAEQQEEFRGFAALGMVTSGLAELQRAASQTAVQPRTLVPKKRVVVSACRMQLDYAQLSSLTSAASAVAPARHKVELQERLAGRVRRRDEDEENNDDGPRYTAESAETNNSGGTAQGFFQISARFPKAVAQAVGASGGGTALKRRRAEAYVAGADGVPVLRTTAVAPGERADGARAFEFFRVQQDAFMNDIEDIKDAQRQRQHRRSSKSKKKQSYTQDNHHGGQMKRNGGSGISSGASRGASKAGSQKTVQKRY